MEATNRLWRNVDWVTVGMFFALVIFGWMNIYGASYNYDQSSIFDFSNRAGKQFVWILTAVFMGGVLLMIDYKTYDILAYILYALMLLILVVTPFLAHNVKGSYSWLSLGPVSLQPAEFAKCVTALAVAKYMGKYDYKLRDWHDLIIPFALIGAPMLIIMVLQHETGSALVFASFLLVFYRQGMTGYILWCCLAAVTLFIIGIRFGATPLPLGGGSVGILVCMLIVSLVDFYFLVQNERKKMIQWIIAGSIAGLYLIAVILAFFLPVNFDWVAIGIVVLLTLYTIYTCIYHRLWKMLWVALFSVVCIGYVEACSLVFNKVLQPHQRTRIEVLLGMKDDPSGAGYNVNQSKIAIGSGRFFGKGYLQGTQTKLRFVPEQDTDFIYCTVGEEWGFLGSVGVLVLFLFFILRLIQIAERQRDMFSQIYAYAVASIFLFHLIINVGMVLGLLPVIGIPLPFFSYGGSSLWGFTLLLAILLRLDASRVDKLR